LNQREDLLVEGENEESDKGHFPEEEGEEH